MIIELAITIQVEIVDHLSEVLGLQFSVTILSLELGQLGGPNQTITGSIDSSEGCVWLEVAHRGQDLSQLFDGYLLLRIVDQYFLNF